MPKVIDITGQRFGRLVVLHQDGRIGRQIGWMCACDCGASYRTVAWNMKLGKARSCGCLRADNAAARKANKFSDIPEYRTWLAMRDRCGNPRSTGWSLYGGRGIVVCERWQESFIAFVADMGPRPFDMTIDRIDPNKGYFKENCRWANDKTQARNKTNSVLVDFHGTRQSLWGLCEAYGVPTKHCGRKLKAGWTVEQILGLAAHPSRKVGVRPGIDWSLEDDAAILRDYPTQGPQIAAAIGRSKMSVIRRAMKLGVTAPQRGRDEQGRFRAGVEGMDDVGAYATKHMQELL